MSMGSTIMCRSVSRQRCQSACEALIRDRPGAVCFQHCLCGRHLSADAAALVWTGALFRAESLRLKAVGRLVNYRVQALALLALTAGIVIAFR